jgi:hypothetical protein
VIKKQRWFFFMGSLVKERRGGIALNRQEGFVDSGLDSLVRCIPGKVFVDSLLVN